MKRKEAREFVMKLMFQIEVQNSYKTYNFNRLTEDVTLGGQKDYVSNLLEKICTNIETIDEHINSHSIGWDTGRMAKADLAILRVAVGEILFLEEVPKAVAINEAVDLAKKYGTDESPQYVNGILSKI